MRMLIRNDSSNASSSCTDYPFRLLFAVDYRDCALSAYTLAPIISLAVLFDAPFVSQPPLTNSEQNLSSLTSLCLWSAFSSGVYLLLLFSFDARCLHGRYALYTLRPLNMLRVL
jgi:hypothetical protein